MATEYGSGGSDPGPSVFHIGPSIRVDLSRMHGDIRHDAIHNVRSMGGIGVDDLGVLLLQGGVATPVHTTDAEVLFRQEGYFHYLFGVREPGWWGSLDTRTGSSTLFVPRLPESHAVWLGAQPTLEEIRARYGVDHVRHLDEMADALAEAAPPHLHVLVGANSDSGLAFSAPSFPGIERFRLETRALHLALTESRVVKCVDEISIMRYAAHVASRAHIKAMQFARPGVYEYEIESVFLDAIYRGGGCRHTPYTSIVGSGPNAAILHYGHAGAPNDRRTREGELVLLDAGAEFHRYASDVTSTFPVSGRFSRRQRQVYGAVLAANRAALARIEPGVAWVDVHLAAERALLAALTEAGISRGDPDEAVARRVGAVFMPHGLGHLLGIDTHDVGGYVPSTPPRPEAPGLRSLRTARVLQRGMVITVEPGCYFIPSLLEPALADPARARFLDADAVRECVAAVGGVRIEDDVVVTQAGYEILNDVPREIEDVEAVCAGGDWPTRRQGR